MGGCSNGEKSTLFMMEPISLNKSPSSLSLAAFHEVIRLLVGVLLIRGVVYRPLKELLLGIVGVFIPTPEMVLALDVLVIAGALITA